MLYWRRSVSVADLNVILIPDPLWIGQSPQLMLSRPIQDVRTINGSGIRNYEEKTRRDLDNSCMDNAAAFNIYI